MHTSLPRCEIVSVRAEASVRDADRTVFMGPPNAHKLAGRTLNGRHTAPSRARLSPHARRGYQSGKSCETIPPGPSTGFSDQAAAFRRVPRKKLLSRLQSKRGVAPKDPCPETISVRVQVHPVFAKPRKKHALRCEHVVQVDVG